MARNCGGLAGWAAAAVVAVVVSGQAGAQEWDAGGGPEWQTLLEAARAEGEVVVSACPGATETMARAFRDDTGIDISFITGSIRDLGSRWDTELRSGRVTTDVRLAGNTGLVYIDEGFLVPIRGELLLPSVTDETNWARGALPWLDDAEEYLPYPAEYVAAWPLVNADLVDPATLTQWSDLLRPEFKGKIAAFDPTEAIGSATSLYLAKLFGFDFVTQLYRGQEAVLSRDRRQLVEWVARGTYPIALGADAAPDVEPFREAGFTGLTAVTMSDGPGNLVGGCSVTHLPVNAPHPNAARVFVNWYLSPRGQEAYVAGTHQPSNRLDVAPVGVPDYLVPRPDLTYYSSYRQTYVLEERPLLMEEMRRVMAE